MFTDKYTCCPTEVLGLDNSARANMSFGDVNCLLAYFWLIKQL